MSVKALRAGDCNRRAPELDRVLRGRFDEAQKLHEVPHAEAAAPPSAARGREDVVRARRVVTIGRGRRAAEEDAPRIPHPVEVRARALDREDEVLGGESVREVDRVLDGSESEERAVPRERPEGLPASREPAGLRLERLLQLGKIDVRHRDADRDGLRVVLRLREELRRERLEGERVVRDDEDLAGPCDSVRRDAVLDE